MRAAALLLILAISTTMVAGAQCVVACVHPASPPPCHHSPQKAAKTCDSSFVFGERRPVTIVEAPATGPAAAVRTPEPPATPFLAHTASAHPLLRPPGDGAPLVLRI
jgi:hypothetical protein